MSRSGRSVRPAPPKAESFEERVDSLFDELAFSIRSDRPSILLVPYASEFIRADVELALRQRLAKIDQQLIQFTAGEEQFDIPLLLSHHPDRKRAAYSILGLSRGGGKAGANAYRALNIRREVLVDYRIRALFWLSGPEARQLSRHAPDFWAFRHRVVDFSRPADINRLAETGAGTPLRALRAARKAARLSPEDPASWLQLGNLQLEYGLLSQALKTFERLLTLAPGNPSSWLGLGHVYRLGQRLSDAIINYRQVMRLDPHNISGHISLIACYRLLGLNDLAAEQMERGGPVIEHGSEYDRARFASICGNASQAVELLALALQKHQAGLNRLRHDPDLDFIRNDPRFQQLSPLPTLDPNPKVN